MLCEVCTTTLLAPPTLENSQNLLWLIAGSPEVSSRSPMQPRALGQAITHDDWVRSVPRPSFRVVYSPPLMVVVVSSTMMRTLTPRAFALTSAWAAVSSVNV